MHGYDVIEVLRLNCEDMVPGSGVQALGWGPICSLEMYRLNISSVLSRS